MDHVATVHKHLCDRADTGAPVLSARLSGTVRGRPSTGASWTRQSSSRAPATSWPTFSRIGEPRFRATCSWTRSGPTPRADAARNCLHVALTGVRGALRRMQLAPDRAAQLRRLPHQPIPVDVWWISRSSKRAPGPAGWPSAAATSRPLTACYEAASQLVRRRLPAPTTRTPTGRRRPATHCGAGTSRCSPGSSTSTPSAATTAPPLSARPVGPRPTTRATRTCTGG